MQCNDRITRDSLTLRDRAFFAMRPGREYRARKPFRAELKRMMRHGHLPPLKPGQEFIVIVTKVGQSTFLTALYAVRLDRPGSIPDTDTEIRAAFVKSAAATKLEKEAL
ncbi:hypothetical protein HHL25_05425 [Rhizobium sp. S-51]|uniref:Uncharacterized protein n=1 Tax=Rhizobium terricola TaxID=2728849 RepID=A0A7Y0AUC0_9HYPH|nr:hypothetical protein [Rhizobium terricola]NML73565.1 hypothetical protein [Rhizobium terricola]